MVSDTYKENRVPDTQKGFHKGFSLIELMIILVILAILSSIAVVSYQQYVNQARRRVAEFQIIDLIAQAEQYHLKNNAYPENVGSLIVPISRYYKFTGKQCGTHCFQVTAEIQGSEEIQKNASDKTCSTLTLDTKGTRTPINSTCWQ